MWIARTFTVHMFSFRNDVTFDNNPPSGISTRLDFSGIQTDRFIRRREACFVLLAIESYPTTFAPYLLWVNWFELDTRVRTSTRTHLRARTPNLNIFAVSRWKSFLTESHNKISLVRGRSRRDAKRNRTWSLSESRIANSAHYPRLSLLWHRQAASEKH